jgi:signal transduction histidine kinase
MKQIVNSLLAYSKVINKEPDINEIDLSKEINRIKNIGLSSLLKETSGTLRIQEPLPVVQGDQIQIRQVFDNLIENALKYCKKDVPPEIIVRALPLDNGMVRIEVEDNGIGIKPEYYENIFAIFRRLNTGHEYEGIGIGLAICKRIIEKHGGEIGVESNYGQGTTFWFTLHELQVSKK